MQSDPDLHFSPIEFTAVKYSLHEQLMSWPYYKVIIMLQSCTVWSQPSLFTWRIYNSRRFFTWAAKVLIMLHGCAVRSSPSLFTSRFYHSRAQLFKANDIVKIYIKWYANMLKFFAEKMWVAYIFSAKHIRILCIESTKTVNEMTLNELVKLTTLWTTGPRKIHMNSKDSDRALSMYSLIRIFTIHQ